MQSDFRVVFMANDVVATQTLAFLESLRKFNPHVKVSMIPFAADLQILRAMSTLYNFDIIDNDYSRWDNLALNLYPDVEQKYRNRLRKLSIFEILEGIILYVDIDTIILRNIDFIATPLALGKVSLICTGTNNDPWVYKSTYANVPQLRNSRRFSDGFFAFNAKSIPEEFAFRTISDNRDLYLQVRADGVYSQPATNFVVDSAGLTPHEVFTLFPNISPQVWFEETKLSLTDLKVSSSDGKEVLFVHWAGPIDLKKEFRFKSLFDSYRKQGAVRLRSAAIDIGEDVFQ